MAGEEDKKVKKKKVRRSRPKKPLLPKQLPPNPWPNPNRRPKSRSQPKKKPKFFVHWDRRKAKFYDYNFDYGTNYYSSMVGYVDNKNAAFSTYTYTPVPRRMAFAERGMVSSLQRHSTIDARTQSLHSDVRHSTID